MAGRRRAPPAVTEALVLAASPYRDDRIVTLLTMDQGRVPAVARKARSSKRRFGGHLDPITRAEVSLTSSPDRSLATLTGATALDAFATIKGDLWRLSLASCMAEVVMHIVAEYDHDPQVYELLARAWSSLDDPRREPTEDLLLLFELKSLGIAGMLGELRGLTVSEEAEGVLQDWVAGVWRPLAPSDRRHVAALLEGAITDASGRAMVSRGFLESIR